MNIIKYLYGTAICAPLTNVIYDMPNVDTPWDNQAEFPSLTAADNGINPIADKFTRKRMDRNGLYCGGRFQAELL